MTEFLGMKLDEAVALMRAAGVEPKITFARGRREAEGETVERVIRALNGGAEFTAAVFPAPARAAEVEA